MVMDDHLEDVLLHQYVKIALAVAIIRRKPKGVTARAYIDDLLKDIKLRDRREEVGECRKVMLERQQGFMAVLSKTDMEIGVKLSSGCSRGEPSTSAVNCDNNILLPKYVPLQCVSQEHPVLFFEEDTTILKNTLLGALEFLTMITQRSNSATLAVPKQLYQACIGKLQVVPFAEHDLTEFKPKIEKLLDSLITCLFCGKKAITCLEFEEVRDIFLSIGTCAAFWDVCVLRLSWHVHTFATSLKPIAKGEGDLASKVGDYKSICYVLMCLEQMLLETSGPKDSCSETGCLTRI
ncbi:uncharacterized protein [Montipora foliosa]|uniref:uncharacterized protein isoform X2 n=1 Tax=Montipora foliosa TaxID=591990 RepID=UPI0035F1FE87